MMKLQATFFAVSALLVVALPHPSLAGPAIQTATFIGMPPPATIEEKTDVYSQAKLEIRYEDGSQRLLDLAYHPLMATNQRINGKLVGGLIDARGGPLTDPYGQMASDAPDGTSLLALPRTAGEAPAGSAPLALITQFEYRGLAPGYPDHLAGPDQRGGLGLPALMSLTRLAQDPVTGHLRPLDYEPIDFSPVHGGWTHCGATLSAWNTHLGAEEYEPDAKTRAGLARASGSQDETRLTGFSRYYFGDPDQANPYHYGLVPEVSLDATGKPQVVKHYAPGRLSREMLELAPDQRTAISGDDGNNTGLFMFIADRPGDLSSGTLYAAKLSQISADQGGAFDLNWIRLGQGSDGEIKALVDAGLGFNDLFDALPAETTADTAGFTRVTTYTGTEWLRLKPGMAGPAAFLETRRYAALLGATTEFSKMEYVAINPREGTIYLSISRVEAGMADQSGDIRLGRNEGGLVLAMTTTGDQRDTQGAPIPSRFVGRRLTAIPELVGGWREGNRDAEGNACAQDQICGPDNLRYVDSLRTLFIGEDTNRRNNNYVWAFNLDTRRLSRILSVPAGAEATGLTVVTNANGHGYLWSNFQHPGEADLKHYQGADQEAVRQAILAKWDHRKKAAIGYLGTSTGALPVLE